MNADAIRNPWHVCASIHIGTLWLTGMSTFQEKSLDTHRPSLFHHLIHFRTKLAVFINFPSFKGLGCEKNVSLQQNPFPVSTARQKL